MTGALDAAGITDPALRAAYERCRRLNAEHGRTYYLSTLLLPPAKRPAVHALYGFARLADDLVDSFEAPDPRRLVTWGDRFLADLRAGRSTDPVAAATVHTAVTWGIDAGHFEAFLRSMRSDITVTGYDTWEDLRAYMYGSAAVIGLQMTSVLEPLTGEAWHRARLLGEAFQLTNFIRDVGEDLRRGRVYLPAEDLAAAGVTREDLARGVITPAVRSLLRFEIARARELYAEAEPGIAMLHPTSRPCVATAWRLYRAILDAVERADHQVLTGRVTVSVPRRLRVALPGLVAARRARRRVRSASFAGPTTPTRSWTA
ncbi:MAG TPA: phytoene/squalene synthase family protein [Pseudonocardiaceae bacterium]